MGNLKALHGEFMILNKKPQSGTLAGGLRLLQDSADPALRGKEKVMRVTRNRI